MGKNDVKLKLRFDAKQVTKALDYSFEGKDGSIYRKEGRCAGTYHFPSGGHMSVKVIGTGPANQEFRFAVTDFTITSIPTQVPAQSPLSMFDPGNACISVNEWALPKHKPTGSDEEVQVYVRARKKLPLLVPNGQWKLSGFLSVRIEKSEASGEKVVQDRLFYFDPESTAGSGGGIEIP